jgi:hypothetical protein
MLIQVISSTTREGRFSEKVATWWPGIDTAPGDREG